MKPEPNDIDPRALRDAFGCFMTGVTIVTCLDTEGTPLGFTANSFASVSLDPPLLSVSIAKSSSNLDAFVSNTGFAINVLAEDQTDLSNRFARPSEDRFADVYWRKGPEGAPLLAGVSAWFDCSVHMKVDAGDHVILIGHVCAFEANTAPGLGYYRGGYFQPSAAAAALAMRPEVHVCAIIEAEGSLLLVDDGQGETVLPVLPVGEKGIEQTLNTLIAEHGVQAEIGPIYSVYEDLSTKSQVLAIRCPAQTKNSTKGAFVPLTTSGLDDLRDQAQRSMLERLICEQQEGIFGVYFGNNQEGRVAKSMKKEATA